VKNNPVLDHLLDRALSLSLVIFVLLCATLAGCAFYSHQKALDLAATQAQRETSIERLAVALSAKTNDDAVKQILESQIKEYRDARAEAESARLQLLSTDTVALLLALWSIAPLILGIKVFSGAGDQIKRFRLISQNIHPMIDAAAIQQSIFMSLSEAGQYARELAHHPAPADHAQACLPLIQENLDEVDRVIKDSHLREIGVHQTVLDRFLDLIGKIDGELSAAKAHMATSNASIDVIKALLEKLDAVRAELSDARLVKNWEDLAKKLDDAF
jgi:hypothetical protein